MICLEQIIKIRKAFIYYYQKFKQFYVYYIDPSGLQPIHALRTIIATVFAMMIYRTLDWSQAYWIVPAAMLIIQNYHSPTPKEKWRFLLIAGILIVFFTFVASWLCQTIVIFALFLMLMTFITVYLNVINTTVGNAAFYVNFFCLSAGALPLNMTQTLERTSAVGIGWMIAITVCLLVYPENLSNTIRQIIADSLACLSEFNQVLYQPLVNHGSNSANSQALSVQRNRLMRSLQLAKKVIPVEEIQSRQTIKQIEYLYEIMLVLNEIKSVIHQQKILIMINKELIVLSRRVTILLKSFSRSVRGKEAMPSLAKFIYTLKTFEKYYTRHLKKFNDDQFLNFTVYIDAVHKLEKRIKALNTLVKHICVSDYA